MSLGKMSSFINIVSVTPTKDVDGFTSMSETALASIRAYKESRHGSKRWANLAAFTTATVLFRFRKIPSLTVTTEYLITDNEGSYKVISVDDVRNRGMYVEVLAEKVEGTVI